MLRAVALALRAPSRRTLEVALLYLIRRDNPSSKEGIKIHHYSGSSPTINVGQQPDQGDEVFAPLLTSATRDYLVLSFRRQPRTRQSQPSTLQCRSTIRSLHF